MQGEGDFRREKESLLEKLGGAFHQFGLGVKNFRPQHQRPILICHPRNGYDNTHGEASSS